MSPLSAGGERELGPHTSGVRSKLSGVRSELSRVRSKLSGVRSKLSGVRSELSGVRSELKILREVGYCTLVRYLERTPCWLLVQHNMDMPSECIFIPFFVYMESYYYCINVVHGESLLVLLIYISAYTYVDCRAK